ncbi:MAG: SPFH domain-containing protein [Phocaeicola sp.]|nr:SPFH domain-containing protein [Phocaeicola sp.]
MNTSKTKTGLKVGIGGLVVIGIFALVLIMFAVERIDSGQTGIIVNLAGSERGVDDAKVETGWVVYNRFTKQLFEYPAFAQIVDYEPFDIQDKKGTIFQTDPTIEYYIERENAKVVFLRYRKTTSELEQSVILTEVKNAYKDVAGLYETDSLINNRPAFEKEVEVLLKDRLSQRGFTFTNIQSSVKPNEVLQAAIDAKNTAVQNALKVENEKKAAIAEAEKVVAAAKGKADANRILQQSITPELIQLKAVEKWDGKLPLSTSGNTLPFLQLK